MVNIIGPKTSNWFPFWVILGFKSVNQISTKLMRLVNINDMRTSMEALGKLHARNGH